MGWDIFPLLLFSEKSLYDIGIISSLVVWQNLPVKLYGLGFFFVGVLN